MQAPAARALPTPGIRSVFLGISTATISRINRCIQYGSGGYRDTIEKVQKAAKPE